MNSTTLVGYTFNAANYCPDHIIGAMPTGAGEEYAGWGLEAGAALALVEGHLDDIAEEFEIDRGDEASYDSGTFPKIVLAGMLADNPDERCACCHEPLLGDV